MLNNEQYQIAKAKQDSGDKLDELAMQLRDAENISYSSAFKKICARNPELFNLYVHGVPEGIKRAV